MNHLLLAKDMNAVADLWAPDGIAEFPFAAGSSPRVLRGREEVRAHLALIALFRDYWSPLSAAAAAGTLAGLIDSLERKDA